MQSIRMQRRGTQVRARTDSAAAAAAALMQRTNTLGATGCEALITSVSSLMVCMLACWVTFLFASSMWSRFSDGVGGARHGGGLLVIVGRGARGGMAASAPMLVKAAVIVAAVMLAIAALMVMLDILGIPGILGKPIGPMLGMLGIPIPMGRGSGRGRESGVGDGVGRGSCRMALGRRLSGMGTPAFAHMAAALALAISSNWSLSEVGDNKESAGRTCGHTHTHLHTVVDVEQNCY